MAKEICISSTPHETRLAILEDDQLAEIYYERENEYTLAGSIYNGRVTRVLPGMQSAFVDIGLERDAFLYVTDFLELEDPEETDELEKAAVSGGNQPPREVRHAANQDRPAVRTPEREPRPAQKPEPRSEQRQEPRAERPVQERPAQERPAQDRPAKDRRFAVEAVPEAAEVFVAAPPTQFVSESVVSAQEESDDAGARRWRGRRRRRGGRGATAPVAGHAATEETPKTHVEESEETEVESAYEVYEAPMPVPAAAPVAAHAPRTDRTPVSSAPASSAPVPFVLPGESLSKYGGTNAGEVSKPESAPAAPPRPASSFKPSTMIEVPLAWDGSGLLPGESISRHRNRQPEIERAHEPAVEVNDEPHGVFSDALELEAPKHHAVVEPQYVVEETVERSVEASPAHAEEVETEIHEQHPAEGSLAEEEFEEEEFLEEEHTHGHPSAPVETAAVEAVPVEAVPVEDEPAVETATHAHAAVEESAPLAAEEPAEPEADAAASHHVDPLPPSGFRIFGMGGKKKKDEESAPEAAKAAPAAASYAPGTVLVEEDFIEEEEFAAPRQRQGKPEARDSQALEEQSLPKRPRANDFVSAMQEARMQEPSRSPMGFDENGDETFEEEDDDEVLAEGQPAAPGSDAALQRRDRNGRGRRGRGGQPGQQAPPQSSQGNRRGPSRRASQMSDLPIISDLLKPGQEILVQIAKEPIAKKGARITSHIALPGRFLVFMPTVSHIGVSRKIESDEERQRLKRILVSERGEASGGFIVRTAAEGASEEDLRADLRFLLHLWNEIKTRSDSSKSPALIYHDLSLIERILRDQVSSNFSNIWVDSEADYERIVRFLNRFSPTLTRRVKLYTKEVPLFEHFGIQDEISKALRSKVWLKSGGSIVINQTEALVAIDINTGKYVGKSARLEDTIVKTNLDAVPEIVRQIRLRDLGGIIVIDFIDMDDRKNRFRVMAALEEALKSDRAPTKVLQFNDFGLVAITRKRVKQSLERTLSVPCPTCQATGMVKSPTTVCNEIYTELRKMKKHLEAEDVLLRVHPETVKVLKANNASWLTEFEELVGKNILIKSDPALHPEQFDIQG
jgi:Rne/Rng family ribonuclease